jgi:hypothetical protein
MVVIMVNPIARAESATKKPREPLFILPMCEHLSKLPTVRLCCTPGNNNGQAVELFLKAAKKSA